MPRRLGSLNAHPTGTPTVAPGTAAFAALLARIDRSDRRHGIRYFYCLGGHALAVAGYQPGPSLTTRRFPPPWSAEEIGADVQRRAFVVKDSNGQSLAYIYYEEEPGRRSAAKLLSKDEARRIAVNIAKLPGLARLRSQNSPNFAANVDA
jgi:hypothetical protein